MKIEERITIKATPMQIFTVYEDVSAWSDWDPDVHSSSIDGEFKSGVTGRLKPAKGPESKIEFTEVTRNKSFTTISKLPLCTMSFEHKLVSTGDETEVVHTVSFSGMLAPLFGRLIGSGIRKGLPSTLLGLRNAIESNS